MTYFNGSMPVFVHAEQDRASFQTIAAQFCVNGNAKQADIVRAFGVTKISLKRAVKRYREEGPKGYYGLDSLLLLLAFMALARLESIESLRDSTPGEWGNLLGLDRVPQRLCLRATTDYWVNAMDDQPLFVVNQVVDPGPIQVIEHEIVPRPLGHGHVRPLVAGKLLQEYARENFGLDRLVDYRTEAVSAAPTVVNPDYRHLDGQVRSATGKLTRRLAKFAAMTLEEPIEPKHVEPFVRHKAALQEEIETLQHELETLKARRK
ncbi:MAG: hypothetical protein LJE91_03820, partial [Gammaproteobacteria bacterium]|nr:hypothetical protein [Gammaproteobacteria bacterium]